MFRSHVLIIRRSKLHYTTSGIITPIGGCLVHRVREDQSSKLHYTAAGIVSPIGGEDQSSLNLCTKRPPIGVMIPEAV